METEGSVLLLGPWSVKISGPEGRAWVPALRSMNTARRGLEKCML